MIVADGMMGRIRSAALAELADAERGRAAGDDWRRSDSIAAHARVPRHRVSEKSGDRGTPLNEFVTVLLQNSKPLVISQAADPVDRSEGHGGGHGDRYLK